MKRHNKGTWMSNQEAQRQREHRNKLAVWFFAACFLGGIVAVLWNMPVSTTFTVHNPLKTVAHAYDPLDKLEPALYRVCAAESDYNGDPNGTPQQFEKDGKTVRWGRKTPDDKGYCQINLFYHQKNAEAMGIDVLTPEGNVAYANYLYRKNGFQDWKASRAKWSK